MWVVVKKETLFSMAVKQHGGEVGLESGPSLARHFHSALERCLWCISASQGNPVFSLGQKRKCAL